MLEVALPSPVIQQRKYNRDIEKAGIEEGIHPIVARVIAGRPLISPSEITENTILQALSPRLAHLSSPFNLKECDKAANRVAQAILAGEVIGLETDHDCDGQTSHAVLYYNLVQRFNHPKEKIRSYIGHRLKEGYGLSESVANRILADDPRPTLLITADNGSSDEPRIKRLKAAGIDVIVTDHHEIPKEGHPESAYACLNPTREDCTYNDPYIAGCMVAWLLMAATRQKLIECAHLPGTTPTLTDSLDFVAVGTVADCVSMARSRNNRTVVAYGLRLIAAGTRPCWRAVKSLVNGDIRSEDLGFRIGPLLNSDGRLATAFGSVSLLLAETDEEAIAWVETLKEKNTERKKVQQETVAKGLTLALEQMQAGRMSLCLYLPDGHTGVHGIAASRIKDLFGRPTVFLAPKVGFPDYITGSVRGIESFHVREALQFVANLHPTLFIGFGGHQGAGGVTLKFCDLDCFSQAFELATVHQLTNNKSKRREEMPTLRPVVWTDGPIAIEALNLSLVDALTVLEPFGREFEPPIFEREAILKAIRFVGDGTHARITIESEGVILNGIWFGARTSVDCAFPYCVNDHVKVAFSVKENNFRNSRTLDINIIHIEHCT